MKFKSFIFFFLLTGLLAVYNSAATAAEGFDTEFKSHTDISAIPHRLTQPGQDDETDLLPRPHFLPEQYFNKDVRLKEAYGIIKPGEGDITLRLGRQQYLTGTGFAWNPTDLFNHKKIMDPAYKTSGIDSAYMSYAFSGENEISTFYSFGQNLDRKKSEYTDTENGDYQVKIKTRTNILDLAIHYSEASRPRTDYEGLKTGMTDMELAVVPVRWRLLAAGMRSEIGGLGIHVEGGRAWLEADDETTEIQDESFTKDHTRFLVGVDYTFKNELYLVLEYYQEGLGKTSPEEYTTNDRLGYINNEFDTIGRDNIFVGASMPIADKASIELYNIINANDPSVVVNPWLNFEASEDLSLSISAQIPVGSEESSIGNTRPSAFGRIQINF